MRILVIDDVRVPNEKLVGDNEVIVVRSSREAIDLINNEYDYRNYSRAIVSEGFDQVWFDHDLGGGDSIRPVVSLLEEYVYNGGLKCAVRIGKCFIHSSNPIGVKWVLRGLQNAGYDVSIVDPTDWFTV